MSPERARRMLKLLERIEMIDGSRGFSDVTFQAQRELTLDNNQPVRLTSELQGARLLLRMMLQASRVKSVSATSIQDLMDELRMALAVRPSGRVETCTEPTTIYEDGSDYRVRRCDHATYSMAIYLRGEGAELTFEVVTGGGSSGTTGERRQVRPEPPKKKTNRRSDLIS